MNSRLAGALVWRDFRIELSYRVPWMLDAIGLVSVLAICCHELTCVNSPPNAMMCDPFMTDTLSAMSFTGEFRRCELVAVLTGEM